MNSRIFGILCAVMVMSFGLGFASVPVAESRIVPTHTRTMTKSVTRTSTPSITPSLTPSVTSSPTSTQTVTPSPTLIPSPTPFQKTEIKLFDEIRLWSGQSVTSNVIDVSGYSEATLFLTASIYSDANSGIEVICYFIPNSGTAVDRYKTTVLTVSGLYKVFGVSEVQSVTNGKIVGPKMICDLNNKWGWSTLKSSYLYLIP